MGSKWIPEIAVFCKTLFNRIRKEKPTRDLCIVGVCSVLLCAPLSSSGLLWITLDCFGLLSAALRCFGLLWNALLCSGLLLAALGCSKTKKLCMCILRPLLKLSGGPLKLVLDLSWAILRLSCACLGLVLGYFGTVLGHLGAILSSLGTVSGLSWAILATSWAIWAPSLSPLSQDCENDPQKDPKTRRKQSILGSILK